jgi:lipid A oxidase
MNATPSLIAVVATLLANPVNAGSWEASVFTGLQNSGSSSVSGEGPGGVGAFFFSTDWDMGSLDGMDYLGARATYWIDARNGVAVTLTRSTAVATATPAAGVSDVSFDGTLTLTADALHRWNANGRLRPYVGLGLGVAMPDASVTFASGATERPDAMGFAANAMAGASYKLDARTSAFAELHVSHTRYDMDLSSGGSLKTDMTSTAINVGLSYRF